MASKALGYYTARDAAGKPTYVEMNDMFEIDLNEAIRRHPKDWSRESPTDKTLRVVDMRPKAVDMSPLESEPTPVLGEGEEPAEPAPKAPAKK